ncbi:GNAT family N-acetyltransferase [Allorhizobium terrae]|uniref:Acetyltransferase n=1 Tax=Allorhizobium terrae TaxID=1848972 RepID=A0A4S3ZVB3_9HYPH|nr:GNAT family N-acetyltransferase [Allorhizobium terrae]THF49671.1 acetyltransferase [Allorhizobium terrae]
MLDLAKQQASFAYSRFDPDIKRTISFRLLEKDRDLELLWRWMNQPHVVPQWKMAKPIEDIAKYIDINLSDPHQDPYIGFIDDTPMSYWEAYWAKDDILGQHYPAQEKDRGWHMLVGEPDFFGRGHAPAIIRAFTRFLFLDDPATMKVVGEPSVEAKRLLRYAPVCAFEEQGEIDLPDKRAKLMFCHRDRFTQQFGL